MFGICGFLEIWLTQLLVLILITALVVFVIFKWKFSYWKRRNLPFIEPKIPFGTLPISFSIKENPGIQIRKQYDELKSAGHKHGGLYLATKPVYFPIDPNIIQLILQQDFKFFIERGFYYNEKDDPLSANLFAIGGEKWRHLRTKLSPAFTSGKMKIMFDLVVQCANQMKRAIGDYIEHGQPIDAKEVMACYTTDVIGSCAFGLECNSFASPNAEFRQQGKKIFQFTSILRIVRTLFAFSCPDLARWLGVRLFDTECSNFFINVVKDAVAYRKVNNVVRKDMLHLLMELETDMQTHYGDEYNNEAVIKELAAQVFIFFAAGFETTSTTLTFCLYELATNPTIQSKLRAEIQAVLNSHGNLSYDAVMEMKYMTQVVNETLRKYPPVSFISRVCVNDYNIPGTNIVLEKGIDIVISILGLHHDPEYYPEPQKFDPNRFCEANKRYKIPFTYMPFGEGPRICIGLRFGLMQTKVALAVLLNTYTFSLNKRTVIPIEIEKYSFTLVPKSEILLDVEKVKM